MFEKRVLRIISGPKRDELTVVGGAVEKNA
jgi:hypothetical protein